MIREVSRMPIHINMAIDYKAHPDRQFQYEVYVGYLSNKHNTSLIHWCVLFADLSQVTVL